MFDIKECIYAKKIYYKKIHNNYEKNKYIFKFLIKKCISPDFYFIVLVHMKAKIFSYNMKKKTGGGIYIQPTLKGI